MGFWHTGYIEFHEYSGLAEFSYLPVSSAFPCPQCGGEFTSLEILRQHRFEHHPSHRPSLTIGGREIGSHTHTITSELRAEEILVDNCDSARLNGATVPVDELERAIAELGHGVSRLELENEQVTATFTLDMQVATTQDLVGIEQAFMHLAAGRRLDAHAIDAFIENSRGYRTAIGYCDGICAYLYGAVIRDGASGAAIPREDYVKRYNRAGEKLREYDRPLARTIACLVAFHFNHFDEAKQLARGSRCAQAAARFSSCLAGNEDWRSQAKTSESMQSTALEKLVSDVDTEQIARWSVMDVSDLIKDIKRMEERLARSDSEFDIAKLHILLAEVHANAGDRASSVRHARQLRNVPSLAGWAERMIRQHNPDSDDTHQ